MGTTPYLRRERISFCEISPRKRLFCAAGIVLQHAPAFATIRNKKRHLTVPFSLQVASNYFFLAAFFAAGFFLAAAFFAGFLAAAFFAAGFLAAFFATFLAAGFLAAAFLAEGLLAAAFLAAGFLATFFAAFLAAGFSLRAFLRLLSWRAF